MTNGEGVSTTQDERTMATLAHALQVVGWWIAPLIIFLVQRKSRFVSFHALQALLLQILYLFVMGGFMVLWFGLFFLTMAQGQADKSTPPIALLVVMPLIWLTFMAAWISMLVVAIVYAIKAGRGEWANYPVLGRMARRMLEIKEGEMTATTTGNS